MSKINVSTITNRTGTSGPVLSGVTTATNGFNVTGGNVGIGTDNPSTSLTVGNVTSPGLVRGAVAIKSQATGISLPYANIYLEEPDIGDVTGEGYYLSVNSAGDLDFVNSGSVTVLTMSDNNNIGIGVTIPSDKLSVYKTNIGNPTGITIRNTDSSSTYSHARLRLESQNGAAYGEIWADVANAGLRLGYNSSSTVKIDSTGNLHFGAGKGIDFSATADGAGSNQNELLDDYEFGDWAPVIKSGTNTITVTDTTQSYYKYIKIGRLVKLFFSMNNASTSGTTGGTCTIGGLPFAPTTDTNTRFISGDAIYYNSGFSLSGWPIYPHLAAGDTTMNFYEKGSSAAPYGSVNVSNVGSNGYFLFTIEYYTN